MNRFALAAVAAAAMMSFGAAQAAGFPAKDVKVIVPYAPGGGVDVTVRMLGEVAPKYLGGHNLIVENMPGGGGVTGQAAGARAKADGYTMLAYTSSVVSNPVLKKAPFTTKDFQPVAMYCFDPELLVVPVDSPIKNLEDFIAAAQKDPVSLATPGHSTSHHIACLMLAKEKNLKFRYVHNKGASEQFAQIMGNHVQSAMVAYGEAAGLIKDGKVRAIGMMSNGNYPGAEKIQRFSSVGFNVEWGAFRGLAVPAKTPAENVKILSDAFTKMTADPAYVKRMNDASFPLVFKNSEDFTKLANETAQIIVDMKDVLTAK
ncbi:MAG: tripartite tricarboxylate transporter substrate binding protein [Duodenibacillus sp.]|nr:tripartite tricarboxylate transporter substrate binding protein [Duodenibacillus sp.]